MEVRRSYDRLISTMGFPILVRWHLYIESGPCTYMGFAMPWPFGHCKDTRFWLVEANLPWPTCSEVAVWSALNQIFKKATVLVCVLSSYDVKFWNQWMKMQIFAFLPQVSVILFRIYFLLDTQGQELTQGDTKTKWHLLTYMCRLVVSSNWHWPSRSRLN